MSVITNAIYKHTKTGNLYLVHYLVTSATNATEGKQVVVYQALYGDYKYYSRELEEFLEVVEIKGKKEYRFTLERVL